MVTSFSARNPPRRGEPYRSGDGLGGQRTFEGKARFLKTHEDIRETPGAVGQGKVS